MSDSEQNKTEEATPFKLKKARDKGQVARGSDLGFFSMLVALCLVVLSAGPYLFDRIGDLVRDMLMISIPSANEPNTIIQAIAFVYPIAVQTVAVIGLSVIALIIVMEILQLRGMVFSTHPLKPDMNRLNPAKGFKRVFSVRMLKETLKNVLKMIFYAGAASIVILVAVEEFGAGMSDAQELAGAMFLSAERLIFAFAALALIVAALDQVISRQEFKREMRMSKSELQRETKDREGEPRQKQKRKELHREYAKQTGSSEQVSGSDLLVINPQHYAVALVYKPEEADAPQVKAKGRNAFALAMKRTAVAHNIPAYHQPTLARALFKACGPGDPVPSALFKQVADVYTVHFRTTRPAKGPAHE